MHCVAHDVVALALWLRAWPAFVALASWLRAWPAFVPHSFVRLVCAPHSFVRLVCAPPSRAFSLPSADPREFIEPAHHKVAHFWGRNDDCFVDHRKEP